MHNKYTKYELSISNVKKIKVTEDIVGQRIDNFLINLYKKIPKNHLYNIIRRGEIRINMKRIKFDYHLFKDDIIRIPPIHLPTYKNISKKIIGKEFPIIYEDNSLLVINKPAGIPVHGGSNASFGIIEQLKASRSHFLELIHRLDQGTSGLLMLAKSRNTLCKLHKVLRNRNCEKHYLALVRGNWTKPNYRNIRFSLTKKMLNPGEFKVLVDPDGKDAHTIVKLKRHFNGYSLVNVEPKSGRTHQIRVHLSASGFPIVGDNKYGIKGKEFIENGINHMLLHAHRLVLKHPITEKTLNLIAKVPKIYSTFLKQLDSRNK